MKFLAVRGRLSRNFLSLRNDYLVISNEGRSHECDLHKRERSSIEDKNQNVAQAALEASECHRTA